MFGGRTVCRPAAGRGAARGALLPAAATHVNAKATKKMQKRRPKKVRPRPRPPPPARAPAWRLGGKPPGLGGVQGSPGPAPVVLRTARFSQCCPAPHPVAPSAPPPSASPSRAQLALDDDGRD